MDSKVFLEGIDYRFQPMPHYITVSECIQYPVGFRQNKMTQSIYQFIIINITRAFNFKFMFFVLAKRTSCTSSVHIKLVVCNIFSLYHHSLSASFWGNRNISTTFWGPRLFSGLTIFTMAKPLE